MRWRPPHLALNPPYCFSLFWFFVFLFVFFWGFKGQVRWPEGPPYLALNPPYCFVLLIFCCLSFLCFQEKNPVFPPRKGHFLLILECLALFLLSLFWPPPFSVFLSLSLSCFFFFFPSCLSFLLYFGSLSSLFIFFLSSLLLFHERNNIKRFNCIFSSILSFFVGFLSCFLFEILFSYLWFPDFQLCFLFNINVVGFKNTSWKTPPFGQKGGCNKTAFSL